MRTFRFKQSAICYRRVLIQAESEEVARAMLEEGDYSQVLNDETWHSAECVEEIEVIEIK